MTADGQLDPSVPEPTETFGHGRRMCPGRFFAMDVIWLTIANVLHFFTIEKAVDDEGRVIEPSVKYSDGMLRFVS